MSAAIATIDPAVSELIWSALITKVEHGGGAKIEVVEELDGSISLDFDWPWWRVPRFATLAAISLVERFDASPDLRSFLAERAKDRGHYVRQADLPPEERR